MEFPWAAHSKRIEEAIAKLNLEGDPAELYDPIRYILDLGGKRIRPVLCLLACELFDGNEQDSMLAALSIEVFHNFTLVHDDIMDEAPLRRGQATVHEKWNRDIAILSGDVMFVKAYELLAQVNATHLPALISLFNQTAIEVCEGQQMDMNFEQQAGLSIEEYLRMIELKTSVLLACSLKMGALISNANSNDSDLIYEFGRNLGIAFQIQDDLLDAYGDPEKFGKRVGGDIISNKKTYLMLSAIQLANPEQADRLNSYTHLGEDEKVEKTKAIFNEIGVPEKTEQAIKFYYQKAMEAMNQIERPTESKEALKTLAAQIMERSN